MSAAEIDRLLDEVDRLPDASVVAVSLLEEAIRIAESMGDPSETWALRSQLMSRVYHTGNWDKLLVHFGWSLAQSDRDPERFPVDLWKYKWVVNEAARMPQIGRERLLGLLEDMERRFRAAGSRMRAVHGHRAVVLAKLGEHDGAREAMVAWAAAPRDWLSDCAACEEDTRAELLAQLGEHDRALTACEQILSGGLGCAEIPHRTHARMLAPLLARGERARAEEHHREGYALARVHRKLVEAHGQHLAFAAAVGDGADAAALLERHASDALAYPTAWERLIFLAAAALALGRMAPDTRLMVRLPEVPAEPIAAELAAWAEGEARELALAFDRRNGNDATSRFIAAWPGGEA